MAKAKPKIGAGSINLKPGAAPKAEQFMKAAGQGEKQETKRITVDLDLDLYNALRTRAFNENAKMTDLLRGWISDNCKQ